MARVVVVGRVVVVVDVVVVVVDSVVGTVSAVSDPDEQPDASTSTAAMAAPQLRQHHRFRARSIRPPGSLPAHATLMDVADKITILLPVDAESPPDRPLAAGLETLRGAALGFVDNGLWQSMQAVIAAVSDRATAQGATLGAVMPFDHLARDFADQRAALVPFSDEVEVVVLGLGN